MKKLLSFALVLTLVLAMAVPVLAAGTLSSKANEWYYTADVAGIVTVKDNKVNFTYEVEAGVNFLGLQKGYTGQLKFVSFVTLCEAYGHNFNQWKKATIQERACTVEGIYEWPCDNDGCNEVYEQILPGAHFMNDRGVDWSCWVFVDKVATYTEAGFIGWVCKDCGEEDGEVIPALVPYVTDTTAAIINQRGNRFTVQITETYSYGPDVVYTSATIAGNNIDNNGSANFTVGPYVVTIARSSGNEYTITM